MEHFREMLISWGTRKVLPRAAGSASTRFLSPTDPYTLNPKSWVPLKGLYRGFMGIMEKKMETTIWGLGFRMNQLALVFFGSRASQT